MKFIPRNEVNLEHALRVTSELTPRQILRIGMDQYVVFDMDSAQLVTAFHSQKFSRLINSLKEEIVDVEIIATRPLLSRNAVSVSKETSNHTTFEIRMYLAGGNGLAFNSTEASFAFTAPAPSIVEETSNPATDHWSLPDNQLFSRLLVTPDFKQWVDQFSPNWSPQQVLERCHLDFQKQRQPAIVFPGKHIAVHGEFGSFVAVEYLCGRICFHQTD